MTSIIKINRNVPVSMVHRIFVLTQSGMPWEKAQAQIQEENKARYSAKEHAAMDKAIMEAMLRQAAPVMKHAVNGEIVVPQRVLLALNKVLDNKFPQNKL